MFTTLSRRRKQPELMDDPALSPAAHAQALRGLERINRWSSSAQILWPPILELARQAGPAGLRLLDVASGGGDVPIQLWREAQRHGVKLHIEGCDRSDHAVAFAQAAARAAGAEVRFFTLDALRQPIPRGYDILTCSLFLHHLDDGDVKPFLQNMAAAAGQLVLVNDLLRGLPGLLLAYVGTRLLSRSPIVHVDGPLSVRAAFTLDEVRTLAQEAGLHGATVAWRWPWRFLLSWRRR